MLENLKQDYCSKNSNSTLKPEQVGLGRIFFGAMRTAGFRAVVFYRIGRWFRMHKISFAAAFIERLMHHLCHCWISTVVDIGSGFNIPHVGGIVIDGAAGPIGKNFSIRHNVTIGGNYGKFYKGSVQPTIGDNVSIGPGASILGPIKIGSNTIIGTNALVTTDIPENSVVGDFRAEVTAMRNPDGTITHFDERFTLSRKELFERIKELEKKIEKIEK